MNVLHVYRTYFPDPPGGLQEAIRQICLATKKTVDASVFALSPNPHPAELDLPEGRVIRARSWWAPASCDLGSIGSLKKFCEAARQADLLHFHFPWPFADLLSFLPCAKAKPKIITYHSDIIRQRSLLALYRPLMRLTLGAMDAVVATSPNYAATSEALKNYVTPGNLKIIPLGIADRAKASNTGISSSDILDRMKLRERGFVLALGVLRYYKGLHTLVRAAPLIDAPVIVAGSGPEREALERLATEVGAKNVVFTGQVTDLERDDLMRACSVFAFPSHLRSEAFGMALVEASMFSKPMICCEIGSGVSFVNQHDVTGLVIQPESPSHLADAANRLLLDQSLALRMGTAARERYTQLFSDEALGAAYVRLYTDVLGGRRSRNAALRGL